MYIKKIKIGWNRRLSSSKRGVSLINDMMDFVNDLMFSSSLIALCLCN